MNSKKLRKNFLAPLVQRYSYLYLIKKLYVTDKKKMWSANIDKALKLIEDAEKVLIKMKKKPMIGLASFGDDFLTDPLTDNLLRYKNFVHYNNIPHKIIEINKSDWIEQVSDCDIIVWGLSSRPSKLEEERSKLYFLEKNLGKLCYPTFDEAYLYEDKIRFYYFCKLNDLPVVNTFISHNESEANQFIESCTYPIVTKISTGSGSRGVSLIKTLPKAKKFVRTVFGSGKTTYNTYLKQKDYVYFQEYISDCEYDLRVIVVGNKIFGYYRMKPRNDFKASGAGIYVKKELPEEAMRIAVLTKQKMNTRMLAVDMIKSESKNKFEIIEGSIFFGVSTAEQLMIKGTPGYYLYENDQFKFKEGKYWVQDLVLEQVIKEWNNQLV